MDLPRLAAVVGVVCLLAMTVHRSGAVCDPVPADAQVACASETGHGCDGDAGAVDPAPECELGCEWCHGALLLVAVAGQAGDQGARGESGNLVPAPPGTVCSADRLPPDPPPVRVG
jgi:hypothetical protein